MKGINAQQLKRCWDFVTLSKFRWYLLLGWIIGWIIPKVISFDYWTIYTYEDMSLYFVFRHLNIFSDSFWAHYPRYLLGMWTTGATYWAGLALAIVIMFLFLVAVFREAMAKERQYSDLARR